MELSDIHLNGPFKHKGLYSLKGFSSHNINPIAQPNRDNIGEENDLKFSF